jgi:hypothetical protein
LVASKVYSRVEKKDVLAVVSKVEKMVALMAEKKDGIWVASMVECWVVEMVVTMVLKKADV